MIALEKYCLDYSIFMQILSFKFKVNAKTFFDRSMTINYPCCNDASL